MIHLVMRIYCSGNRDHFFEIERIKKLPLILVELPHHGRSPSMPALTRRNHHSLWISMEFCNKIGQEPTSLAANGLLTRISRCGFCDRLFGADT
jgi:hypothetical protein